MADIIKTYTIPDKHVAELIDVFSVDYSPEVPNPDYDPEVEGSTETIANPQSRAAFASKTLDKKIISEIKKEVMRHRSIIARQSISSDFDVNT